MVQSVPADHREPAPDHQCDDLFDDGNGPQLVLAGQFHTISTVPALNIIRWNGTQWEPMGNGLDDEVHALTVFDDHSGAGPRLCAGGGFNQSGSVRTGSVARWTGAQWEPVSESSKLDGTVYTLAASNAATPILYAGGAFSAGGATNIASFAGVRWFDVGGGAGGTVRAVHVVDEGPLAGVYVGGSFSHLAGRFSPAVPANNIAKWDGAVWTPLGAGTNSEVRIITSSDVGNPSVPSLYVAGGFTQAGGVAGTSKIARWNAGGWNAMDQGVSEGAQVVRTISQLPQSLGGHLAIAGAFRRVGANFSVANFVTWDGAAWRRPGNAPVAHSSSHPESALDTGVRALAVHDDGSGPALFVGGAFSGFGDVVAGNVGKWTGTRWRNLDPLHPNLGCTGCSQYVAALLPTQDDLSGGPALYACGDFTVFHLSPPSCSIARWNGTAFTPLGAGLQSSSSSSGLANAMAFLDEPGGRSLIAAGRFDLAGGVPVNNIARWDGSAWSPLGNGLNDSVSAVAIFDDGSGHGPRLYAAGSFTASGKTPLHAVAVWDGQQWLDVGAGLTNPSRAVNVGRLLVFDDHAGAGAELYAVGTFQLAGGVFANGLARWNGVSWAPFLDDPASFFIDPESALTAFDDARGDGPVLYVSGRGRGGTIGRWNGHTFTVVTPSPTLLNAQPITALAAFRVPGDVAPSLFVGGSFTSVGSVASHRFAQMLPCLSCAADFDHSGAVNSVDFFSFLNAFFSADPAADINDDDVVDSDDFFDYIEIFFAGCT